MIQLTKILDQFFFRKKYTAKSKEWSTDATNIFMRLVMEISY